MECARDIAAQMEQESRGIVLGQFSNPDNPLAHCEGTGPEIWCWSSELVLASVHSTLACPLTVLACLECAHESFRASRLTCSRTAALRRGSVSRNMDAAEHYHTCQSKIALRTRGKVNVPQVKSENAEALSD